MEIAWLWAALLATIAAISGTYAVGAKRGWRRRLLSGLCILLVVAAVGLAVSGSFTSSPEPMEPTTSSTATPATTEPVTATEILQLNAVDPDGNLREGFVVTATAPGSCEFVSEVLPDAYKCSFKDATETFVADPCLPLSKGASAFCLNGPWDRAGTIVDLENPVDSEPAFPTEFPSTLGSGLAWAIEVADPDQPATSWRCLLRTGASWEIANHVVTWSCARSDGSGEGAVLDVLITDRPVWRALLYDPEQTELVWADVISVWD